MTELVTESKYHRTLHGFTLAAKRDERGLSQQEFANLCGWTQSFQSQLERTEQSEVHIDIVNKILAIL